MKQYTVWFTEPVDRVYKKQVWNEATSTWSEVDAVETKDSFTFFTLSKAKSLIKKNIDKYAGSSITKTYANGDWVNCGEISLPGTNKTFIANSRQKKPGY